MIVDTLNNLDKYVSLNPLFAQAFEYLKSNGLNTVETGTKVQLRENALVVNFEQTAPKTKEQAKLETHRKFIDIQIPLSGVEVMGYAPLENLTASEYNAERDITFYESKAEDYITVKPGMFVIFFPQDAHAPAISETGVRKVIVKVLV